MPRKRSESVEEHASQLAPRFYTLTDVASILACSDMQVYSLVRTGDLPGIKIGGRGVWRVEISVLDEWIAKQYETTQAYIGQNPYPESMGGAATWKPEA